MKLNKDIPFTVAPNALIQDETITTQARFLYVYMASMPDDWTFYMSPLAKKMQMTVKTLRKYIDELEASGWLTNHGQQNQNGAFGSNAYTIHSSTVGQKLPYGKNSVTQKERNAKNSLQTKETSIQKKQKEKKKEEKVRPSFSLFEVKQAITKHLNKAIKKKEWLELIDGLDKDVPGMIEEIADAWIGKDRNFNPNSRANQKGIVTFARSWCENIPRTISNQTEGETIISEKTLGNNPDAVYDLIEKTLRRPIPNTAKDYYRTTVAKLLKEGKIKIDTFSEQYPILIREIPNAKQPQNLFENYERLISYIQ